MTSRPFRRIESEDNRTFKQLATTLSGRGIRKHDAALVSGSKIVADILRLMPERCEAWISTPKQSTPPDSLPARAAWYEVSPRLFRKLDVFGTETPLLLVKTPAIEPWHSATDSNPDAISSYRSKTPRTSVP